VSFEPINTPTTAGDSGPSEREQDAIYQNGRIVARVLDPTVDTGAKEVRFGELYCSDLLVLPDECEYQKYRIMVQRIEYASKLNKEEPQKGRILRGVTAEILGYREQ
jgi:hypothetical protein